MKKNTNPRSGEQEQDKITLGERLREAREYTGFSQEEVARFLGIARSALSNIESGRRRVDVLELKKLAQLYQYPVTHFTGDDEGQPNFTQDVTHLARRASDLSPNDREELARFADFLHARDKTKGR